MKKFKLVFIGVAIAILAFTTTAGADHLPPSRTEGLFLRCPDIGLTRKTSLRYVVW